MFHMKSFYVEVEFDELDGEVSMGLALPNATFSRRLGIGTEYILVYI